LGRVGSAAVLAVAYYGTAKLGLELAIPPGYATAVWPPAGIALAGVLLRPRAWPGVVLGSFLANLPTALEGDASSLIRSGLVGFSIGLGAAAQAIAGSLLVRHFVGFPNSLADPRAVGLFYLLGGPVACLLNSTWGVATLVLAGVAQWRDVAFNWWTWWVGDVIGCLTVAPLILVWAARARGGSLRRPLAVCVPLLLVFASIVVLFLYTSRWESDRLRSDFERRAEGIASRVTGHVGVYVEVLRSVANLYSSTSVMNARAFHDFVAHPLARHPGIQAISWNVHVDDARREAFEASVRQQGYAGFQITERGPEGNVVRARRRAHHVAVTYIEPRAGNTSALGFDVASDPARLETLTRARQSGAPEATGRIRLVQETGDRVGFLVVVPSSRTRAAAAASPRPEPEAFAVGVFRVGEMLEQVVTGVDTEGLEIELRDLSAPPAEQSLYRRGPGGSRGKPAVFERKLAFVVAGREWAIVLRLLPEYLAVHRPWQAWSVLAAGLLFGGLLGAFQLVVTGRTIEVEQLVHKRTSELEAEARERGRAQRELERVMGSVSDTLWAAEVKPGGEYVFLYCSPNVESLTGRSAEFFVQGPDRRMSIVAEEDRPRVREMTERLVSGLSEHEEAEYRVLLPDGRIRWVRDSLTASRSPGGDVQLSGVLSDVTAARESERLSRERETQAAAAKRDERFRSLIENASDMVLVLDPAGTVLYASPSAEAILGNSPDRVPGTQILERVDAEDRDEFRRRLAVLTGRAGSTGELRFRVRDNAGSRHVLEGSARNLADKPEVGGIVVNCRDVTERDRLENQLRQAQKMEAVGQLAGGVAHDFNNLLGVITGYGDLLLKEMGIHHPWAPRLVQMRKAAERASALTRQLLAFSRKQLQRLEVLDLNAIVSDVGKMLRRLIGEDIQLVTVLGPNLGPVRADPGQIEQVIVNLALNARDAMPTGGKLLIETSEVELDKEFVQAHPGAAVGPHVVLSVTDTGHGMDQATLSHIFEPFFTTKDAGKGTGLGLATVYGIVKQSQGHVDVQSAPGRGATFRVYLPRLADGEAKPLESEVVVLDQAPRGSETVLLVEDDSELRGLLKEILCDAGYQVLEAARPREAIELARSDKSRVDLLLTDVIMPDMSGPEVADAVCAAVPGIKVVYMSGYTDEALGRHRVLDPGTHLLEKPFSSQAVLLKLREVLDGRPPGATTVAGAE